MQQSAPVTGSSSGKKQEHGVIAFELRFYPSVLKPVRDHFAIEADLPLPPGRPVGLH
jgi:hypothetical protein